MKDAIASFLEDDFFKSIYRSLFSYKKTQKQIHKMRQTPLGVTPANSDEIKLEKILLYQSLLYL